MHMLDLLGGWPGALIAQQQSRHKTVKASFQAAFWFTVLANLAGAASAGTQRGGGSVDAPVAGRVGGCNVECWS